MNQPPPSPVPHLPPVPPRPALDYGQSPGPALRVGDFLFHFAVTLLLVVVLAVGMNFTGRMRRVFTDFHLELPAVTRVLLGVHDAYRACFGWAWLWAVPFLAPLLMARLAHPARRRVSLLATLLAASFVVYMIVALYAPMLTLLEGISNSSGTKR